MDTREKYEKYVNTGFMPAVDPLVIDRAEKLAQITPGDLQMTFFGSSGTEAIADVINFHTADNVGYFVAEPLLGEGGLIVPPDDYFRVVKEVLEV